MERILSFLGQIISILFGILFGRICGEIAKGQGRDVVLARIMGFFFGIITLIVYLIKGDKAQHKNEKKNRKSSIEEKISIILCILGVILLVRGLYVLRPMFRGVLLIIKGLLFIIVTLFLVKNKK